MKQGKNQWSLAVMLGLMVITGYVVLKDQPLSSLVTLLGRVKPGYIVLGFGLMLAFVSCEALCSRLALGAMGHKTPFRRCLGYSFSGFYFSSITPSSTGGQPAQVYYMSKDGVPAAHGTLDMLLVTVCFQVATLIYAIIAWFTGGEIIPRLGTGLGALLGFGGATMAALTAMILLLMFRPVLAGRMMNGLLNLGTKLHLVRHRGKAAETLAHQMAEYRRGAELLKCKPGLFPAMLLLSFLQLTCMYLVPYVVYRAFGLSDVGVVTMIATQALVTLAVSCLPLPGAVGVSEAAFLQAFTLFFGVGLVTPAMLVSRSIAFYGFLLLAAGVTLCVHLRRSNRGVVTVAECPAQQMESQKKAA